MENYFRVLNHQIPIELKSLYQEISKEFEAKVYDSKPTENIHEIIKESDSQSHH